MLDKKFIIKSNQLKLKLKANEKIQIIDIREQNHSKTSINGVEWIPASKILNNIKKIKSNIPVILYCDMGVESFFVANILHEKYKFTNIYSLKGGINNY